jgi:hypothetical protein
MNKNSYLIDLSESEQTDFGRTEFDQQSEPQKVFTSIWALESQVNNGGFLDYFVSSEFDTANFAPTALSSIGANACASIVQRALDLVPTSSLPSSREACQALVDSIDDDTRDKFKALDSEFFDYPDNLTDRLFEFVASHPEAFGAVPEDEEA